MDITSVLAQGRQAAEARMTDTCQVGFEVRSDVLNETTGEYPMVFTPIYDGPCEFRTGVRLGGSVDAASQLLEIQNAVLKLPIAGTTSVVKDMLAKVTSSATDPGLPGAVARVTGPFAETYSTARRFQVEVTN